MTAFTKSVSAAGDDGYAESGGGFNNTNAYVMVGSNDPGGGAQTVHGFYRFTAITIDRLSPINSASVTLYNCSTGGPAGNIYTYQGFVAADNQAAPTDKAGVWALSLASGYVTVNNPGSGTVVISGLATSLQSVIDRTGWANGNAVVLKLQDNGSTGDRKWTPGAYSGYAALLSVDYSPLGRAYQLVNPIVGLFERMKRRTKLYQDLLNQGAIPLGKRELLPI